MGAYPPPRPALSLKGIARLTRKQQVQRLKVKRLQEARLPDSGLGQEAAEDRAGK